MSDPLRVFVYEYVSGSDPDEVRGSDADGLLEQGRAMRDALVSDLAALDGVATTFATRADEPKRARLNATAVSADPGERPTHFLRRFAALNDCVWVVAPETGGILADLHVCVGAERWLGCDLASIRTASSKRATVARLRAHAIRTTRIVGESDVQASEARWIVKPDDGAGSCDAHVHRRLADALAERRRREARGECVSVEWWEEGDAASLSLLCGMGKVEVLSVNRQHVDVDAEGCVRYRGVDADAFAHRPGDRFDMLAREVVRALPGLRGYVGVDLVMTPDGDPVVVEVNPRLTSAYVGLSASLGRNVARDVLELHGFGPEGPRGRSLDRAGTSVLRGIHEN